MDEKRSGAGVPKSVGGTAVLSLVEIKHSVPTLDVWGG